MAAGAVHRIELWYDHDCPHAEAVRRLVATCVAAAAGPATWEVREHLDAGVASPTLTVDGRDVTGQDVTGPDVSGQDVSGQDVSGQDVTGHDLLGHDLLGQALPGQEAPRPASEHACRLALPTEEQVAAALRAAVRHAP